MAESTPPSMPRSSARKRPPIPSWLISALLIFVAASWIPLVLIARARVSTSSEPRVQIAQDMSLQPKYREQMPSEVFADGRADRPRIFGTVARGQLQDDDHYYRGFAQKWNAQAQKWEVSFFNDWPRQVKLTRELLQRGQDRFNIYCSACHGADGYGNGPVNARAVELQEPKWVPAASLHSDTVRQRSLGHLYNMINNGIRNMPGYGAQIPVEDRWAIVAYLKTLQFSQNAPAKVVPAEKLQNLR
ncbi:MAG: c-type cytochrome [Bacillota bacterium]